MRTTNRDGGVRPIAPDTVSCAVCEVELPLELAVAFEGEEYSFWFCSNECFVQWKRGLRDEANG